MRNAVAPFAVSHMINHVENVHLKLLPADEKPIVTAKTKRQLEDTTTYEFIRILN